MIKKILLLLALVTATFHSAVHATDEGYTMAPWQWNEEGKGWVARIGDGEFLSTVSASVTGGKVVFLIYRECLDVKGMVTSITWTAGAKQGRVVPCKGPAILTSRVRALQESLKPLPREIEQALKKSGTKKVVPLKGLRLQDASFGMRSFLFSILNVSSRRIHGRNRLCLHLSHNQQCRYPLHTVHMFHGCVS